MISEDDLLRYTEDEDVSSDYSSTKTFSNFPCAHRQWRHDGNCALIHGYSRSFVFHFRAVQLSKEGFVVDYGDLDELKAHLEYMYDHTIVLAEDDPHLDTFKELEKQGVCHVRTQPGGPGMEGTAQYLCIWADVWLRKKTGGRAWVVAVEARENDKNSSVYYNPLEGFQEYT